MNLLTVTAVLARAGGGESFGGGLGGGLGGGGGGLSFGGSSYGGGFYGGGFGSGYGGGGASSATSGLVSILLIGGIFVFGVAYVAMAGWRTSRGALLSRGGAGVGGYATGGYVSGAGVPTGTAVNTDPSGYDDSHPVGVPQRFQGGALPGTSNDAVGAGSGGVEGGVAEIKAHDPAFDEQGFVTRVERVFFIVEQAWSECKPEMSRQVMADGVWQQHRSQIEGYVSSGRRNMLDQLAVGRCDIINAHSDATYDSVTVAILAASADYDIDTKSGRVVRGNRNVGQWQEHWLFQRSSSAVTKPDGGIAEKHCPNCGAPLDVDLAGVCSYCKAPVMSGKYDWVLTRIDQVGV